MLRAMYAVAQNIIGLKIFIAWPRSSCRTIMFSAIAEFSYKGEG